RRDREARPRQRRVRAAGDEPRHRARAEGAIGGRVRPGRDVRAREEGVRGLAGQVIMPRVTIYNPRGEKEAEGEAEEGATLLETSVKLGAKHGSACGGVCACSTCHVWVKKGFASLGDQSEEEADQLDKAYDVKPVSRLGCQAHLAGE